MRKKIIYSGSVLCLLCVIGILVYFHIQKSIDEAVAFEKTEGVIINGQRRANEFGKRFFRPRLVGKRMKDGSLHLLWLLEGWPDKMAGIIVKRQENGKWIPLVDEKSIIVPGTYFERDWKAQGLTAEQSAFYSKELKRCYDEKKVKLIPPQQQLELARKYGFGAGDGLAFMRNNLYAFLSGFAAIDNHPIDNGLYGLFGVSDSGNIDHHPFVTWRNQPLEKQVVPLSDFTFVTEAGALTLFWEIPEKLYKDYAIVRFEVYQKENNEWKYFSSAQRYPQYPGARYGLFDPLKNNLPDTEFKFVPHNMFNEPLPAYEMKFESAKYGDLTKLEFKSPEIEADNTIVLSWETGASDQGKIKSFRLERDELWGDSIVLAENMQPDKSSFTDKKTKKYNARYTYKLIAYLNNGSLKKVEQEVNSPVQQPKLPAPKNFKVKIVKVKEDEYKLHFSWDPVPGAMGYLFHLKNMANPEAVYAQQGGCRQETSFEEEYPASHQTFVYSYAIQALTANADIAGDSELSVVENMQLLAIEPDEVEDVTYSQNAGEVSLSWKNIDPSTTGLEIFINGESYQKLPPTATSITIPEIKKTKKGNKTGWVDIDIVNYNPMGKNKTYCGFMYYITPPEARKFPKIENFQGRYVEKDGQRGIELTWTPLDLKKLNLSGYDLTLYIRKGTAEACHSLCDEYKKNHYFYAIPAEVSPDSELEFKIQATQAKREKWPPTILRGPWVSTKFVAR